MGKCKKKKRSDSVFQTFRKINVKKHHFKNNTRTQCWSIFHWQLDASLLNLRVNSHFFLIYTYPYFQSSPSFFLQNRLEFGLVFKMSLTELLLIEQLVKVESNSTAIYRIMRTGTVAFLGEGVGFKGPRTASQTSNIIRWPYSCSLFRKKENKYYFKRSKIPVFR